MEDKREIISHNWNEDTQTNVSWPQIVKYNWVLCRSHFGFVPKNRIWLCNLHLCYRMHKISSLNTGFWSE